MAADQIVQDRRHAAIGNQGDLGAGHLVEHLGGEMHPCADAAMTDGQLARVALRQRDDVEQRLALERRRRREDEGRAREPRHRHNVLLRVVGHFLAHGEIGAECARTAEPDRVAVGCGLRDRVDPDHGARAGLVLDHDRLPQLLLQAELDSARHRIRAAAGRKADDETNRLVGIGAGAATLPAAMANAMRAAANRAICLVMSMLLQGPCYFKHPPAPRPQAPP